MYVLSIAFQVYTITHLNKFVTLNADTSNVFEGLSLECVPLDTSKLKRQGAVLVCIPLH